MQVLPLVYSMRESKVDLLALKITMKMKKKMIETVGSTTFYPVGQAYKGEDRFTQCLS